MRLINEHSYSWIVSPGKECVNSYGKLLPQFRQHWSQCVPDSEVTFNGLSPSRTGYICVFRTISINQKRESIFLRLRIQDSYLLNLYKCLVNRVIWFCNEVSVMYVSCNGIWREMNIIDGFYLFRNIRLLGAHAFRGQTTMVACHKIVASRCNYHSYPIYYEFI